MDNFGAPPRPVDASMAVMPPHTVTPEELRQHSAQFAKLSNTLQPQLENASRGVLHKDLLANLKAIEKLAKKMQQELRQAK